MIRFFLRLSGFLLVAAGFVVLVIDGARSIANQKPMLASTGDLLQRVTGERFGQIQPAVEQGLHPLLWDPLLVNLLALPAFVAAIALGFLLLRLGRRPEPGIGFLTRA